MSDTFNHCFFLSFRDFRKKNQKQNNWTELRPKPEEVVQSVIFLWLPFGPGSSTSQHPLPLLQRYLFCFGLPWLLTSETHYRLPLTCDVHSITKTRLWLQTNFLKSFWNWLRLELLNSGHLWRKVSLPRQCYGELFAKAIFCQSQLFLWMLCTLLSCSCFSQPLITDAL